MSGCVPWTGGHNRAGYGRATPSLDAHRKVWIDLHGEIPVGLQIHHTCGNKGCVNTAHMELVTRAEHHQRHLKGVCKHGHPFTAENTYVRPSGVRCCRECGRIRDRERWLRNPVDRHRRRHRAVQV